MTGRDHTELPDEYVEAAVHRLLAESPGIAEQGINVLRREHSLVLHGEVESPQRREEILRLLDQEFPELPVTIDIGVVRAQAPSEAEELP